MAAPPSVGGGSDGAPFRVTKSVAGIVKTVDAESVSIEDMKTRKLVTLLLAPSTKPRVSGGTLDDIKEGASVRVNYAANDRRVLDVRVLTKKSAAAAQ